MQYPLNMSFKILALAPQIRVTDGAGAMVMYVKQKLFKLKEEVNVFADDRQAQQLYQIKADRVIDFSARYDFTDVEGNYIGSVKRQGVRSIWRARYDIFDGDEQVMKITEENPWSKVFDSLLGQVPVLGMFTGYFFHPSYIVTRPDGQLVARCKKQPAFFEGKFAITLEGECDETEEKRVLLSYLMMMLLERARG